MTKIKDNKKQFTVNMDKDLFLRLEDFAQKNGINRSGAISILLNQAFDYKTAVDMLPKMLSALEAESIVKK